METQAERARRIQRLEQQRTVRRGQATTGELTEIAPGRGNLNTASWIGPDVYATSIPTVGNGTVSFTRLFQTQPWIAAAVMRMLTWSVRVPLKVYRRTGQDSRIRLREEDHPLAAAIIEPWNRGNTAGLIQHLLGPVLVHGNSLVEIEEGARGKITFGPRDWRYALPMKVWRDEISGFRVDVDDPRITRDVSIDHVIHVAWWSPAGPVGTSPLQQLGVTLQVEEAAQRYQKAIFKNSARPPSAVVADESFVGMDPVEKQTIMAQLRQDINDLYSGPENMGRPALLPPGLDWKPIGHTAVEAALIEQRKVARDEVCAVYLIPPPMLGVLDKATFSNIEIQREMTYTDCLGPPLVLIEQCINSQVVRALLRETDVYCEFDFAGVLRGDRLKEIQALREAISSALLTPNEGRAVLNYQRADMDEMDTWYLPTNNLAPVGTPNAPGSAVGQPPQANQERQLHVKSQNRDYVVKLPSSLFSVRDMVNFGVVMAKS